MYCRGCCDGDNDGCCIDDECQLTQSNQVDSYEAYIAAPISNRMLYDAHCHLNLPPLYADVDNVILRAKTTESNVSGCSINSVSPLNDGFLKVISIYNKYPEFITINFGLHPRYISDYICEYKDRYADELYDILDEHLIEYSHASVGETGLDKNCEVSMDIQVQLLKLHITLACKHNRIITLHCVRAWGALLDTLKGCKTQCEQLKGIILHSCNNLSVDMQLQYSHCFNNIYYSFNGKYLHSNKEMNLVRQVSLDRLLLETDSPDQLPRHFKDTGVLYNEPSLLQYTCVTIADILKVHPDAVAHATTNNAHRLFSH